MSSKELFLKYLDRFDRSFDFILEYAAYYPGRRFSDYLDETNPLSYVTSAFIWLDSSQSLDYWKAFNDRWLDVLSAWQERVNKSRGRRRSCVSK